MLKLVRKVTAAAICAAMLVSAAGCGTDTPETGNTPPFGEAITVMESDFTDKSWDGSHDTRIELSGSSASITGSGASVEGSVLTITEKGTYLLSGSFAGQIKVDAADENVRLVFSGVDIACSDSSAVYVVNAKNVYITLADGTSNTVSDGSKYVLPAGSDEPNAAIFSHDDIFFDGGGSLSIKGNYNNGIRCKDDIEILSGSYNITAADNGISGKDSVSIKDGSFVISAGGDGIRSTNDADPDKGWIHIAGGTFDIDAAQDGIQAYTTVNIAGGAFDICTSGGSKGIKAGGNMMILCGTMTVDSTDDSLHSGGGIEIVNGEITLSSRDDAVHADGAVIIHNGTVCVADSYEGIEASSVTINGGNVNVVSSDDGINVAGGNDGSANDMPGRPGEGNPAYFVKIAGGEIRINADGDGIDTNGSLFVSGGNTCINGSENDRNTAVDYALSFEVTGGTIVAFGSAGMAMNASRASTQPVMMASLSRTATAGIAISITTADGEVIYSGEPEKDYRNVLFSAPSMKVGDSVTVVIDSETAELPIEDIITSYGTQGGMGGPGGPGGGPGGGPDGR